MRVSPIQDKRQNNTTFGLRISKELQNALRDHSCGTPQIVKTLKAIQALPGRENLELDISHSHPNKTNFWLTITSQEGFLFVEYKPRLLINLKRYMNSKSLLSKIELALKEYTAVNRSMMKEKANAIKAVIEAKKTVKNNKSEFAKSQLARAEEILSNLELDEVFGKQPQHRTFRIDMP